MTQVSRRSIAHSSGFGCGARPEGYARTSSPAALGMPGLEPSLQQFLDALGGGGVAEGLDRRAARERNGLLVVEHEAERGAADAPDSTTEDQRPRPWRTGPSRFFRR